MGKILTQAFDITNEFNTKIFLENIKSTLNSEIFNELINKEKEKLIVTVTISSIE